MPSNKKKVRHPDQITLSDVDPSFPPEPVIEEAPPKEDKPPKKLAIDPAKLAASSTHTEVVESIPRLVLPTRWEKLQPRIESNNVSLRTIVRPIPQAMAVIRNIVEYLRTTDGCQVLVIRADTGSGKTTFLNTLPHYMQDVQFYSKTIELQQFNESEVGKEIWNITPSSEGVNLIILEGREKPADISDSYIQVVLANINRFARANRVPILFVIPTIEEQVARNWCEHGTRIGDLIPEQTQYEGSRWYNFSGVQKYEYIDVVEETVKTLNPPYTLQDFGISSDEAKHLSDNSPTIGRFIEVIAKRSSDRRGATTVTIKGKKEHVWIVYCAPDTRHRDHTFLVVDSLCLDEKLKVSPSKLIPPDNETTFAKEWRKPINWARLVAAINFLDVRLINFPINTLVAAALAYGDDALINSFKEARFEDYKEQLIREGAAVESVKWDEPLIERKYQVQNARDSIEKSNLFALLRRMPASQQKGGSSESVNVLAQYLHLREKTNVSQLHNFIGQALDDILQYHRFSGFIGVETETPLIKGQTDPVPDITVHTETDVFALEFHFMKRQITPSEVSFYAVKNVIEKYMRALPHLNSQLKKIE